MNDKEEHTITENITPLQKNIAFRLLMWALVPILAAIGWQLGHAYSQTLDNEYVVDSKILVTNPHIEDDNENSRLTALGRTRDDTVLLGEATNSEEFHQRLSERSGVNAALFEITGTATRTTRVVTIRVSSKQPEISSAVSSALTPWSNTCRTIEVLCTWIPVCCSSTPKASPPSSQVRVLTGDSLAWCWVCCWASLWLPSVHGGPWREGKTNEKHTFSLVGKSQHASGDQPPGSVLRHRLRGR